MIWKILRTWPLLCLILFPSISFFHSFVQFITAPFLHIYFISPPRPLFSAYKYILLFPFYPLGPPLTLFRIFFVNLKIIIYFIPEIMLQLSHNAKNHMQACYLNIYLFQKFILFGVQCFEFWQMHRVVEALPQSECRKILSV